jgi:hypothetical protein
MNIKLLYLFTVLLFSYACTSGKKALQKGNYEASVMKSINRLRNSPNNKKASETLQEAYPLTVNYHLEQIALMKSSQEAFKWERILQSYQTLTNLHNELQRCPAGMQLIRNSRSYLTEIQEAKMLAAEDRYQAGKVAFQRDQSRESAKEAYFHFRRVIELVGNNYKDTQARMDEAKYIATIKVVVEQIPVHSRSLSLSNEFFQNKINEFLNGQRTSEFVRFYTPQEAKATKLKQPDHIIRLQFDDFVVGQVYMKESTETFTRDSVVVGKVKVEGVEKPVYGTVSAKLTRFQKTVSSRGLMDLQIYDAASQRILSQNKMPGEFVWRSEWGAFNGDERALNKQQLTLCKSREIPPPAPQDLFIEFCKPIYTQVTSSLQSFYRNY